MQIIDHVLSVANPNYSLMNNDDKTTFKQTFFNYHQIGLEKYKEHFSIFSELVGEYLFNKKLTDVEIEWLPPKDIDSFYEIYTKLSGFGNNFITINSLYNTDLNQCTTVYDYSYKQNNHQMDLEIDYCKEYPDSKYLISLYNERRNDFKLYNDHIRFINDNEYKECQLTTLSDHLETLLSHFIFDQYKKELISKSNYSKATNWFFKTYAQTIKEQCEEIDTDGIVFLKNENDIFGLDQYVFLTRNSAKNVSWLNFYDDINKQLKDDSIIETLFNNHKNIILSKLNEIQSSLNN